MPLNQYQKVHLRSIRSDERIYGVTLWTLTESGIGGDDIYAVPAISSGARIFSGAVGWTNTVERSRSEGGYHELSDVTIVASLDEKQYLNAENAYLAVENINIKIDRMVECLDTAEIVVYGTKLR